jgi:hypothetical protein
MTDVTLPTDVGFTDADIHTATKRDEVAYGYYRWIVTDVTPKVSKAGNLMLSIKVNPLTDPEDASAIFSVSVYHNLILPLANPNVPGHSPNKMFSRPTGPTANFIRAALGDKILPQAPRKDEAGSYIYNGESLTKAQSEEVWTTLTRKVFEVSLQLWQTKGADLISAAFYAELYPNEDFRNLTNISAEPSVDLVVKTGGGAEFRE